MGVLVLFGLAVVMTALQAVILAYLWSETQTEGPPALDAARVVGPPQFFHESLGRSTTQPAAGARSRVMLQRLEQHIRLEQAAAESFHQFPTAASLHQHTASPLLH